MNNEVWVLGATGRTGRAVATRLHEAGVPLALVGRDRERLEGVVAELGGAPRLLAGTLGPALAKLAQDAPAVVVNTVGPFTTTAPEVARACPPGTHYVDVANELPAVERVLELDRQAAAADQTFVTGAGFGVLATESVVLRLCEGQPPATRVRVDALASVATEPGVIGSALAGTIVEILSFGGRQVRQGRLVRSRFAADPQLLNAGRDVVGPADRSAGPFRGQRGFAADAPAPHVRRVGRDPQSPPDLWRLDCLGEPRRRLQPYRLTPDPRPGGQATTIGIPHDPAVALPSNDVAATRRQHLP